MLHMCLCMSVRAHVIKTQVGCITNVDSYSVYACTYVASVRDISTIVCYDQVLFVEVTKLLRFLEKTTNIFAASGIHKSPRIIYCACALTTIRYWKITLYTVCSQFKHYVGLVNLPHSSSCPMFPYAHTFACTNVHTRAHTHEPKHCVRIYNNVI